jgi:ligand-binding sensor domain-containing protein
LSSLALVAAGTLWVGGSAGLGRYVANTDGWTVWKATDGLVSNQINSLAVEQQTIDGSARDIIWAATNAGVSRFDVQAGTFQTFTTVDGLPSNTVQMVLVMTDGTKLFATDAGVARYTGR